jgi:transposase
MSLPDFSTQGELFSTAGLSASLFAPDDRYRLFAQLVYPHLADARPALEKCYCAENGRVALEPVLMLGMSLLQYLDGVPDRQAVELLRYHAGWNFALNRQLGDPLFHPTSLVNFRHRLEEHQESALGFTTILQALEAAGLVAKQSRQRLDSTQIFGRVARMSRLDCVCESLRLALQELEAVVAPAARPSFWGGHWERYVDSQIDYRAGSDTLARKLTEAGSDAGQLLEWLREPAHAAWAAGAQAQLLGRVFGEQFVVQATQVVPLPQEKVSLPGVPAAAEASAPVLPAPTGTAATDAPGLAGGNPTPTQTLLLTRPDATVPTPPAATLSPTAMDPDTGPLPAAPGVVIVPKANKELASNRVQNPHDPDATYGVKGHGEQKKEHVGYKIQVAETVCEATLAPGEPTRNFVVGMVTHPAYESDEAGAVQMEQEQAQMGLEPPPVQYVDGAYVSAQKLAEAQAQGRELMGPAQVPAPLAGRFSTEAFQIRVEERTAICPAGNPSTQCSRIVEAATGKVTYRFEFGTPCQGCPLRGQCLGAKQHHRTVEVGEHHSALQARRQEQQTEAFRQRMKHRNAIEGTQSELVRAHGLRRARYRGLAKVRLQNYFIGAACNVKRWIRREAWQLRQTLAAALVAPTQTAPRH